MLLLRPAWRARPLAVVGRRSLARGGYRKRHPPRAPAAAAAGAEEAGAAPWAKAVVLAVGAGTAFGSAGAFGWVATAGAAPEDETRGDARCSCAARVEIFDGLSDGYDAEVGGDEFYMGLPLLRRWLLRSAEGDVLEVAAGTGANFHLYPPAARTVLATDASPRMLAVAATKAAADPRISTRLATVERLPRRGGTAGFDTVVDTFGLCSYDDPVAALVALQRATRPGGRILLLEHGRSHYDWLNRLLDKYAARHLDRWGCSWNRDYLAVIDGAGLQVTTLRRFHFGTTYFVVATPSPSLARAAPPAPGEH